MKNHKTVALVAIAVASLLPSVGVAQSVSDLDAVVASGVCPSGPSQYALQSYWPCVPLAAEQDRESCKLEIDKVNRHIIRYNEFVQECMEKSTGKRHVRNDGA